MSVSYHVVLNGPIPEDAVLPEERSYGQNLRGFSELSALAGELGLTPLDDFLVDFCGLVDAAVEEAEARGEAVRDRPATPRSDDGGPHVDDPPDSREWEEEVVFDESSLFDPKFPASFVRAVERVNAELPWFPPGEGLRTMLGLVRALRERPDLDERFYGASWDLQFFACQLAHAEREGLKFYLGVSY